MNDYIQLNLLHEENIYMQMIDISTMCLSFDHSSTK